jgi:hypothetical protein
LRPTCVHGALIPDWKTLSKAGCKSLSLSIL